MGFSLNSYTRMILLIFTRMHATLHYVGWLVSHFPLFVCPSVSNTIKFWTIQSVLRKRKKKTEGEIDRRKQPDKLSDVFFSNDTTALSMGLSLNSYTRMILLIFTRMHATLKYVG